MFPESSTEMTKVSNNQLTGSVPPLTQVWALILAALFHTLVTSGEIDPVQFKKGFKQGPFSLQTCAFC